MNVFLRSVSFLVAAAVIVTAGACDDDDNGHEHVDAGPTTQTGFAVTPLLSDQAGVAPHQDPALVNAWGLAMDNQSFWIANNGTGRVLVVAPDGSPSKSSPPAAALTVVPGITGIVSNPTTAFVIGSNGSTGSNGPNGPPAPAQVLVSSETGQVFAINPTVAATPQLVIDRSDVGAVYKGLAIATGRDGTVRLFVADFHNARIDVFDSNFQLVTTVVLVDPNLRPGLAPFNVVAIGQNVYVTYAIQDADAEDDVPGVGNGRIDVFDIDGNFVQVLLDGDSLNAPWGVALAPSDFGSASGDLIVGNFGDGTLVAIDQSSGNSFQLLTPAGDPLVVDGLWGLMFGNGTVGVANELYFAAGPNNETHGLFGKITVSTTVTPAP